MDNSEKKREPDTLYMQWMEDFHLESKRRENYSDARLDLLTISICGGGLFICLETLKFLLGAQALAMPAWPIKVAGVLFTAAIGVNFWSQHTGKRCNVAAAQWARYEALHEKNGISYPEQERFDREREQYADRTRVLNHTATALMVLGVAFLVTVYITCL